MTTDAGGGTGIAIAVGATGADAALAGAEAAAAARGGAIGGAGRFAVTVVGERAGPGHKRGAEHAASNAAASTATIRQRASELSNRDIWTPAHARAGAVRPI
jgi:hypothetical protein